MDAAEAMRQADKLLSGAADMLQQPLKAPGYKSVDLSASQTALDKAAATRTETAGVIDTNQALMAGSTTKQKDALVAEGEAVAAKAYADQARSQAEADSYKFFADMFGITASHDSLIAQAAKQVSDRTPVALKKYAEIQDMQKVGFLDDPISWLVNTIQLPAKIKDYNAEAGQIDLIQQNIDNGINTSKNASDLAAKGLPTITTAMAAADATRAKAKAAQLAAQADENLAKTNVSFAINKLAGDMSIATATAQMTSFQIQENHQKYAAAMDAVRIAESHATRQLAAGKLLNEIGQTAALDTLLENYDRQIGNQKGTTNRYIFNRMSDVDQKNITAIGAGSGGADPYQFMLNFSKARPGPLISPETKNLLNFIAEKATEHSSKLETGMTDKAMIPLKVGIAVTADIEKEKLNPDKSKIFRALTPAVMLASGAIPLDSPVGKVLEPLSKTPGVVDTATVVNAIMQEYKNPTEAGQVVAAYYGANIHALNNSLNLGLANIKPLTAYTITSKGIYGGDFMATGKYNLLDPADATKYVIQQQIAAKQKEMFGQSGRVGFERF